MQRYTKNGEDFHCGDIDGKIMEECSKFDDVPRDFVVKWGWNTTS